MAHAALRLLAIALPLVGLGALWAYSDYASRQGEEWDVPIEGYDPRDLLRGHYVEFTYDWPELDEEDFVIADRLCLHGEAPEIDYVTRLEPDESDCDNEIVVNLASVYGYDSLATGRLYLDQDRALEVDEILRERDQQGIVTISLREDGIFTPIDIRFEPLDEDEGTEDDPEDDDLEEGAEEDMEG